MEKTIWLKYLKLQLNKEKIILLKYQNNYYVSRSRWLEYQNFLQHSLCLNFLHYFVGSNKIIFRSVAT